MPSISFQEISEADWRATLQLTVHPDQQRFVADYVPIAAIILAKAYIRPGGLQWMPYAIRAQDQLIGLLALVYESNSAANYWIYHFFIDQEQQGKGQGKAALHALVTFIQQQHPNCQHLKLTVHPENTRAQRLYTSMGFQPTGEHQAGEPVYAVRVRDKPLHTGDG